MEMPKGSILLGTPEFWGRTVTNVATLLERINPATEYKTAQLHERVLTADWTETASLLWDMYQKLLFNRFHLENHRDRWMWNSALRAMDRTATLGDVVLVQDARKIKPQGLGQLILIEPEEDQDDGEHGCPPLMTPRYHIRTLDGSVTPWINCDLSVVPTDKHFRWDRDRVKEKR